MPDADTGDVVNAEKIAATAEFIAHGLLSTVCASSARRPNSPPASSGSA